MRRQVIITTRAVYHKIASVTVYVPPQITEDKLQDWLWENEDLLFVDTLDKELSEAKYEFGFGLEEDNGMEWLEEPSETRYDLIENNKITFGGHL
jgi:hypothetical protein